MNYSNAVEQLRNKTMFHDEAKNDESSQLFKDDLLDDESIEKELEFKSVDVHFLNSLCLMLLYDRKFPPSFEELNAHVPFIRWKRPLESDPSVKNNSSAPIRLLHILNPYSSTKFSSQKYSECHHGFY